MYSKLNVQFAVTSHLASTMECLPVKGASRFSNAAFVVTSATLVVLRGIVPSTSITAISVSIAG